MNELTGGGFVYADNAATTKISDKALRVMTEVYKDFFANPSQPYTSGYEAAAVLKKARCDIAAALGAEPSGIIFTSGGSESDNLAVKGGFDTVITSQIEHKAVLNSCKSIAKNGAKIILLPVKSDGTVENSGLEKALSEANGRTLVSVMHANNEIGTIQNIAELSQIAHSFGAVFHTDAVQTVGHIPVNVNSLGCDMLSASAHKFGGPRGIGFLFVKSGTELSSLIDGGGQESGRRAGTENVPGAAAMAAALCENAAGFTDYAAYMTELENRLLSGIKNLDFIKNGAENHLPGLVSLSFKNTDGEALLQRLDLMGICVSAGSACNGQNSELSHVIRAIGVPEEYARGTIRISFGRDNTIADADKISEALQKIIK